MLMDLVIYGENFNLTNVDLKTVTADFLELRLRLSILVSTVSDLSGIFGRLFRR